MKAPIKQKSCRWSPSIVLRCPRSSVQNNQTAIAIHFKRIVGQIEKQHCHWPSLPSRSNFVWLSVLPWKLRCLSPLAFVGSSQSHMISMRCRTFNATAGGYMRGDGCSGLKLVFIAWKPSSSNPGESIDHTCNESPTFRIHPDQISVHCTRTTTISCD